MRTAFLQGSAAPLELSCGQWNRHTGHAGARAERGEETEGVPRAGRGRETELGQQREVGRRQPWVTLPERQKKPA